MQFLAGNETVIVWLDCMKYGTMTGALLDTLTRVFNKVMRHHPENTCGFIIAPHLVSDRHANGMRDELRYLEAICVRNVLLA